MEVERSELTGCVIEKRDGGSSWAVMTPHSHKGHHLIFASEDDASAVCELIREAYLMGQSLHAMKLRQLMEGSR